MVKISLSNPVISVVIDYCGNLFFLLHNSDNLPNFIHVNSTAKQRQLNISANRSASSYKSKKEYDEYVRDSYMDASREIQMRAGILIDIRYGLSIF